MNAILSRIAGKLPKKVQPYAKAVMPSVATVGAVVAEWGVSGTFNRAEIYTAGMGAVSALVAYVVPNLPGSVSKAVEAVESGVADDAPAEAAAK